MKCRPSAVANGIVTVVDPALLCLGDSAGIARLPNDTSPAANFESVDRKNLVVEAPAATFPLLSVVSFPTMAEPGIVAVAVLIALTARSAIVTAVCARSTWLPVLLSVSLSDPL